MTPRLILCCIQVPTDALLEIDAPAILRHFPQVELRLYKLPLLSTSFDTSSRSFRLYASLIKEAVLALVLPHERDSKNIIVGLACTSMSFMLGANYVDTLIHEVYPSLLCTDMARAQYIAVSSVGMTRISMLTPYTEDISVDNANMICRVPGVSIVEHLMLGIVHDHITSSIPPEEIEDYINKIDTPVSNGILIGCSAFRVCEPGFIDEMERVHEGKPVVTSTQAFLWHMLRQGGITDQITGYGRLFREH
jgi:maleate cis-trans isomerase